MQLPFDILVTIYGLRFLFMDNRFILCETRLLGRQPHASVQRVLEQITKWWLKPVQLYSNCINSKKAFNDFESVLFCSIKSVNDMIPTLTYITLVSE